MGLTISGTQTVGVHLTSASQNPVSVTSTGAIITTGSYAIYGTAAADWTITNGGTLSGGRYGISLAGGGHVTNGSAADNTASISASAAGLYAAVVIAGGLGTMNNYGAISGEIRLQAGGTVTNGSNNDTVASIFRSVIISGGGGSVANYGSIYGVLYLLGGGRVINGTSGDTSASIDISGGTGTVINSGLISTYGDKCVYLGSGGSVINGLTGNIGGSGSFSNAIFVRGGAGTIINDGAIGDLSYRSDTVVLFSGGSVINGSSSDITASINSNYAAVLIEGGAGTVTNYGAIESAIYLYSGGNVTNGSSRDTTASIGGVMGPTYIQSGTLTNYGKITNGVVAHGIGLIVKNFGSIDGGIYVYRSGSSAGVINTGLVTGGFFLSSGVSGVKLAAGGTLANSGTIAGGSGGDIVGGSGGTGVDLAAGGTLANSGTIAGGDGALGDAQRGGGAGGTGVDLAAGATLINRGTVAGGGGSYGQVGGGNGGTGVSLDAGTLMSSGTISGGSGGGSGAGHPDGADGIGVLVAGGNATVTNTGRISGLTSDGVSLAGSGALTNGAGGVVTGGTGVGATGVAATIVNRGSITGSGNGIYLGAGGNVRNLAGAHITGTQKNGMSLKGAGSVSNSGTISGSVGVFLAAGGTVTNTRHGLIGGSSDGVLVSGGNVTVVNAGTISGPTYAIDFKGGGTDALIVDPGAVFSGTVNGSSATSALVLASAASVGRIAGLGTSFAGFKTVTEAARATWNIAGANSLATTTTLTVNGVLTDVGLLTAAGAATVAGMLATTGTGKVQLGGGLTLQSRSVLLAAGKGSIEIGTAGGAAEGVVTVDKGALLSGAGTIKSSVVDRGGIEASGGRLTVTGGLIGTGAVSISSHSVLAVNGKMAGAGLTFLSGGSETAVFSAPTAVSSTLAGFAASDTIDLVGFVKATDTFANHTLTIHSTGGNVAHLRFATSYARKDFAFGTDHHGGTNITFV